MGFNIFAMGPFFMNKFFIKLYFYELKHKLKHFGQKYSPKSPLEVYNTIIIYKFGLENYSFNKGKFKRKC